MSTNLDYESFKINSSLILLLELERLSPGYIKDNFINPIINGDVTRQEMFFSILNSGNVHKDFIFKWVKELIQKVENPEFVKLLGNEAFFKYISEELMQDLELEEKLNYSFVDSISKKYDDFYKNYPFGYGFELPKENVIKIVEIEKLLELRMKDSVLEKFESFIADKGIDNIEYFKFETLMKLMKLAEEKYGLEEANNAYTVFFNEKIKLMKDDDFDGRNSLLTQKNYGTSYLDCSAVAECLKKADKGEKDVNTLGHYIKFAVHNKSDSIISILKKNYSKKISEDKFAQFMFHTLTKSTEFSYFKKFLYKRGVSLENDMLTPIYSNNPKSLSKGMAILLSIKKNKNVVEYKTKEKILEWEGNIKKQFGYQILFDALDRNVFEDKENIDILNKLGVESLNNFLYTITSSFNLDNLKENTKTHIKDEHILKLLKISTLDGNREHYNKDNINSRRLSFFVFKNPLDFISQVCSNDFVYENKEKIMENFTNDLIGEKSQIKLNLLLQCMALNLIPEKYKTEIFKHSNDGLCLNENDKKNLAVKKISEIIPKSEHYLIGLTNLMYNGEVKMRIDSYYDEFQMRKDLVQKNQPSSTLIYKHKKF